MSEIPSRPLPDTLEATEAAIAEVEAELASLEAKMDAAKARLAATGEYADPDWWARIKIRKRFTGQYHQQLLRHAARLRRGQRAVAGDTLERAFIEAARKLLHPDTFSAIMEEAQEAYRG